MKKGFTLIELLAVIIVLSLLVVFAYPNIVSTYRNMKISTMIVKENDIKNTAKSYIGDCLDPSMKYGLSGCSNTDMINTSGYVLLEDMVSDQYTEPVEFEKEECEGYISFTEDDYQVCIKCGDRYETENASCNFETYNNYVPGKWDGTSEAITPVGDTYTVMTPEQLAWISDQVNSGANSFEGKTILLGANLDMGAKFDQEGNLIGNDSHAFTPIGSVGNYEFKGDFDGQNHKISNLYINTTDNFVGLIGRDYGTSFKDVTVENSYIKSTGAAVGIVGGHSSSYLQNLEIRNVKSINNIIIAVTKCAGGVVGQLLNGSIKNSYNNSVVNSPKLAGGLAGYIGEGIVENNTNDGRITGTSNSVGGIVGSLIKGNVRRNTNNGIITGEEKWIGGIVGIINPATEELNIISDNINNGEVRSLKGAFRVGGIIGNANDGVLIYNNINNGNVDGVGDGTNTSFGSYSTVPYGIGGIAGTFGIDSDGLSVKSYLYNNYNKGNVKGGNGVGGIVGNLYYYSIADEAIKNTINEGTVEATSGYAGGIIGTYHSDNTSYVSDFVTNSYNKGEVKGLHAAGLVGANIGIKNSITVGTLSGTNNYGVIGNYVSGVNISNVYYPNIYTSSYGTSVDRDNISSNLLQNTLGNGFKYTNGVQVRKVNIEYSNFEITKVTYSNITLN